MRIIRKSIPIAHQGGQSYWRPPSRRRERLVHWLRVQGWRVAVTIALVVLVVAVGMWYYHA